MIGEGLDSAAAARWAVEARNALKLEARDSLPRVVRWGVEQRNIWKHGNPVGPSADVLLGSVDADGLEADELVGADLEHPGDAPAPSRAAR